LVLRELGIADAAAFILGEPDDLAAFRRAFYENASFRNFTVVEKALVVERLLEHGEDEQTLLSSVLPFFRLSPTKATVEMLRTISEDDPETLELLQESDVPPSGAVILAAMPPGSRKRVARILVPLSRNKQSELLEDLADLSTRDGRTVEDILDAEDIRAVLADESLSSLQKSDKVRERLNRDKNPRVWAWKEAFARSIKRIVLPKKTQVRADPGFESEELTLTVSFGSAEEFMSAIGELEKISREKDIAALFKETGVRPG
jgi:hypothetical protein